MPQKRKPAKKIANLKVLTVSCPDIDEEIEIVIGRDGFHFFNFPSASLKTFLKESAKVDDIWNALPNYERREF